VVKGGDGQRGAFVIIKASSMIEDDRLILLCRNSCRTFFSYELQFISSCIIYSYR
jgi:hypothetical protein